jgi:cell division protein FtsB
MDCPVCKKTAIPDESRFCPSCQADLEIYPLIGQIEKKHRTRFWISLILGLLAIIFLAGWIITSVSGNGKNRLESLRRELNLKIDSLSLANVDLKAKNDEMSVKLAESPGAQARQQSTYTVKEGESLFIIARKIYGNGFKYDQIVADNKIADPDRIMPGQKLVIYH